MREIAGHYNDTAGDEAASANKSKARRRSPDLFYLSTPWDMPSLGLAYFAKLTTAYNL
jgi:hypothetical protein